MDKRKEYVRPLTEELVMDGEVRLLDGSWKAAGKSSTSSPTQIDGVEATRENEFGTVQGW